MNIDRLGKAYSHIFWDWNGTLLDDVRQCIDCFNHLLAERGLAPIAGMATYREHFSFPVQNYYQHVGFDLEEEPFERLAVQYISLYHAPNTSQEPRRLFSKNLAKTLTDSFTKLAPIYSFLIHAHESSRDKQKGAV